MHRLFSKKMRQLGTRRIISEGKTAVSESRQFRSTGLTKDTRGTKPGETGDRKKGEGLVWVGGVRKTQTGWKKVDEKKGEEKKARAGRRGVYGQGVVLENREWV